MTLTLHVFPAASSPWLSELVVLIECQDNESWQQARNRWYASEFGDLPTLARDRFGEVVNTPQLRQRYEDIVYHMDALA